MKIAEDLIKYYLTSDCVNRKMNDNWFSHSDEECNKFMMASYLYKYLSVECKYDNWLEYIVVKYDLIEDEDYFWDEDEKNYIFTQRVSYVIFCLERELIHQKITMTYILYDKNNDTIKIGKTRNILMRINQFKTANPNCILFAIKHEDIEKKMHAIYKHLHICLEWFKCDKGIMQEIVTKYGFQPYNIRFVDLLKKTPQ